MRVVVTGGAGFVGANLCRRLGERGDEVVVVDDLSTGDPANLDGVDVDLREGSILDGSLLDDALAGADAVVHLAARASVPRSLDDPVAAHRVNATGTVEVLEAVRRAGSPPMVVASSSSVYGANEELPKHAGLAPRPMSPYAASKLAAESYALAYQHSFGVPVLVFRFFNVFGPLQPAGHDYAAVIPAFLDAALAGRPLPVFGDGTQTRDFTYVDTVTDILAEAVRRGLAHPDPVDLAFGTRTDLLSLIGAIEQVLGQPLEREFHPPRPGDVVHSQADADVLRSLFPEVEPVALEAGLAATAAWLTSRT